MSVEEFPKWKPQRFTWMKIISLMGKEAFKSLRSSSSDFIANKKVRKYIFNRDNNKCVFCGLKENLQIDHIVSVYRAFCGELSLEKLNTKDNLQTLCKKCNAGKAP